MSAGQFVALCAGVWVLAALGLLAFFHAATRNDPASIIDEEDAL
ncbi:transcriptional regulator GlxA family with amidase domain [Microvirga lupini]|uniref:Transcriptional regulator GlxA family with amidase domain n=1 Tax=Microvirga lupini TaxID=420324 RepID=A0A7W4YV96_9HYPH|nr:hypothetical protein [Microvirga lupini]MBB3017646.1 transcriptional regulator GlxA family with amidase domain [Microvirga lupini]